MEASYSRKMLRNSIALVLAVRCRSKEAVLQLLHRFYHELEGKEAESFLRRTIYLLEPKERDWMKSLA